MIVLHIKHQRKKTNCSKNTKKNFRKKQSSTNCHISALPPTAPSTADSSAPTTGGPRDAKASVAWPERPWSDVGLLVFFAYSALTSQPANTKPTISGTFEIFVVVFFPRKFFAHPGAMSPWKRVFGHKVWWTMWKLNSEHECLVF